MIEHVDGTVHLQRPKAKQIGQGFRMDTKKSGFQWDTGTQVRISCLLY